MQQQEQHVVSREPFRHTAAADAARRIYGMAKNPIALFHFAFFLVW